MPTQPLIRSASPDDAGRLAQLCDELGYPSTEQDVLDRLVLLDDPERALLIAVRDDVVLGFIDVHVQRVVEEDAFGEVGGLVVSEGERGTGLGRFLLDAAAEWSRARSLPRLWIRANLAREGVHEFYVRVGCRHIKDQRVYEYPL